MKDKKITVISANHKYQAIIQYDLVRIACIGSNLGNRWKNNSDPHWHLFSHEEIVAHNSDRFSFPLREIRIDRKGFAILFDSINCKPFKKIQEKVKAFMK